MGGHSFEIFCTPYQQILENSFKNFCEISHLRGHELDDLAQTVVLENSSMRKSFEMVWMSFPEIGL